MKPRNPIHPGEMLLEEFLRPAGASQRQLAAKLDGLPPSSTSW
jgi:plasmid maintenance system antidote protein VapI